jgi:hypothetical protein
MKPAAAKRPSRRPFPDYPLAELHAHLGTSISAEILWQIAHEQGFKLPK